MEVARQFKRHVRSIEVLLNYNHGFVWYSALWKILNFCIKFILRFCLFKRNVQLVRVWIVKRYLKWPKVLRPVNNFEGTDTTHWPLVIFSYLQIFKAILSGQYVRQFRTGQSGRFGSYWTGDNWSVLRSFSKIGWIVQFSPDPFQLTFIFLNGLIPF